MMKPAYIISTAAITPQHTYDGDFFQEQLQEVADRKLFVKDVNYTQYISPVAIRRMSRMLKIGITAGMRCLENADNVSLDAIITGTSRGSVTDMELFLKDMIKLDEEALNPTTFIQSTYNSVNGWLAVMAKCSGYNQAFVHRGFSFEVAIFDTLLMLHENTQPFNILMGCFDELTHEYFTIREKIDYYKTSLKNSLNLLSNYHTSGSIAGEGAHFFLMSNEKGKAASCIRGVEMLYHPNSAQLNSKLKDFLERHSLTTDDIDLVVSGMNADCRNAPIVFPFLDQFTETTPIITFKQLTGEFATANGFALWLADLSIKKQQIDQRLVWKPGNRATIQNVLLFNITINNNVSLILLSRV